MAKADKGNDLGFTGIFSVKTPAAIAPPVPRKLPEDIVIGAKAANGATFVALIKVPPIPDLILPENKTSHPQVAFFIFPRDASRSRALQRRCG